MLISVLKPSLLLGYGWSTLLNITMILMITIFLTIMMIILLMMIMMMIIMIMMMIIIWQNEDKWPCGSASPSLPTTQRVSECQFA